MSCQSWLLSPLLSPHIRAVFVSLAVNSTYPSPKARARVEAAPALPQPVVAVFVKLLPEGETPTALLQTAGSVTPELGAVPVVISNCPLREPYSFCGVAALTFAAYSATSSP